jgi:hypothetical protein
MAKKEEKKAEPKRAEAAKAADVSKEEQIGFHKGSLMTLSKERQELVRILGIVEQLMQMHANALNELGVKLDQETQAAVQQPAQKPKKPPIEDIL